VFVIASQGVRGREGFSPDHVPKEAILKALPPVKLLFGEESENVTRRREV
jgi:hypothetical protein